MKDERLIKTTNRPTREDTRAENRPERQPISGSKNLLNVRGVRDGFHACWVNEPNVPAYQAAGYTFVDNDVTFGATHVQQANPLGARYAKNVGLGMIAYLMEIPIEYYNEDRAKEAEEVDAVEASIKRDARSEGLDHGDLSINFGRG